MYIQMFFLLFFFFSLAVQNHIVNQKMPFFMQLKKLKLRRNNWSAEYYRFDEVFADSASQKRIYEVVAKPVVEVSISGAQVLGIQFVSSIPLLAVSRFCYFFPIL